MQGEVVDEVLSRSINAPGQYDIGDSFCWRTRTGKLYDGVVVETSDHTLRVRCSDGQVRIVVV